VDPGVIEGLLGGKPLGGVDYEQVADEVLGFLGDVVPVLGIEGVLTFLIFSKSVTFLSGSSSKGAYPPSRTNKMTPRLHMSTAFP